MGMTRLIATCAGAASLLAASLALQGCCGQPGCGPIQGALLNLPASVQPQATVTACRNGACVTGLLPAPSARIGGAVTFALSAAGSNGDPGATLYTLADGLVLMVSWYGSAQPPHDGDAYSVTVADTAGSVLTAVEGTATYSNEPNGCTSCTFAAPLGDAS
jgi:hypothetical protein